jgi:cobalt-zinc-cadmium efflux system outer membrane protein
MQWLLVIMLFLFMPAHTADAGTELNMEKAEKLFLENNLDIRSKKIELQKSDAAILELKTLPNPAVRYSMESLKNGVRETEETYSVSQEVDITGKRGKRIEAAHKSREATDMLLKHEIAGLLVQMKQSFYKMMLLKENEKAFSDIVAFFSDVEEKISARVKAGDAAESVLMKFTSEKKKVIRGLDALRTDLNAEKRRLALLLNIQPTDFDISGEFAYKPLTLGIGELTELAQRNRPDIKSQDKTVEAAEALLAASKKWALLPVDLEAGYKKRTGGFNGFIFGVSIPLPLFNRNQGDIARGQAELDQEKLKLEALKKTAAYEVNLLLERIASLQTRIADLSSQIEISRELTRIAGISYEEGETGPLDLLDAVRSEKELAIEYNSVIYEYWASLFELEKVSGTKLTQMGGAK